jgi:two-component system, OmpR family, phosphate regulon sensor histidine kinase PhoR
MDQSAIDALMWDHGPGVRALIDALDEPTLVVEHGVVALANAPARSLLGNRVEGRDVRLAIRHPQALEQILGNRGGDLEVTGIAEPGRPWRLSIKSLGKDIVLVRMFDTADLVAAEKMRVDFVANASHELRTPLSTIGGYAETLAEENDLRAETRSTFGRIIRDESRRMLRIIEDLMSLSRIQADRFVAPSDRVTLGEVIQSSVANAAGTRGSCQSRVNIEVQGDIPLVQGDRAQLVQLFDNLISNALRYGCDKPDSTITISARRDGRWAIATVADHGPGIPREHLPRVTERFYRVDAARSRESGGTGLGLAIVKHIVERHKGSLEIRSTLGVGTSVTVRLPLAA